jgi:hypothetical protein
VEVRRNLARPLAASPLSAARAAFAADLVAFAIVEMDAATCDLAATIAEQSGARSLDALDLGAARRLSLGLTFLPFDVRQAQVARGVRSGTRSAASPP